jgi:hypothetical protein
VAVWGGWGGVRTTRSNRTGRTCHGQCSRALASPRERSGNGWVSPVRYQIHAAISGAQDRLDARAILQIREQTLGGRDSVHLALGGPGIRRLQVKGLTLSDGRRTPFRLTADSSEIVLPLKSSGPLEVAIEWSVIWIRSGVSNWAMTC